MRTFSSAEAKNHFGELIDVGRDTAWAWRMGVVGQQLRECEA